MSALARGIVRLACAVIADGDTRVRYREQWLADVDGAAEIGIRPTLVAIGAALAACRLAVAPRSRNAWTVRLRLPRISPTARRILGVVQLGAVVPYLWVMVFYAYARVRLGVADAELFNGGRDPRSLSADGPLMYWVHGLTALWLALHGWILAAALSPAGLLLCVGGRRSARWLPLAGALAATAVTVLALSDLGWALRGWFTD
jgi:hypothetical protein